MTDHNEITSSHIEDNVGNGISVMKGDQVLPDPGFDKEVEASLLEESSMVHEDLWFDEVKKVDTPIPHVGFVILEEFIQYQCSQRQFLNCSKCHVLDFSSFKA